MALTWQPSTLELKRVAGLAYEQQVIKVALCTVGSSGLTAESSVSNWLTREITGNGYSRFSVTTAVGAYDVTDARYEVPFIDVSFSATTGGSGFSYDRVAVYVDGATNLIRLGVEDSSQAILPGQSKTWRIQLGTSV